MIARIISGILIYTLAVTQVVAQTATLLPNAKQTFLGTTGAPLAAGTVTLYVPNSTTKKTTWVDPNQASANTNPIVLDAAGRATIFGQGNYRQIVKDKNGVTIWDAFTSAIGSASPSGSTGTDTAPVGTVIPYSGFAVPTNWALAYGQPLNRVTYAQLLAAITISNMAVSCTASSTTLTGFASTAQFSVGEPIEATCLAANTTIASITNSTTIVVSAAAVSSGAVTAVVFPWGNGDGNSTFNVPDLRGRTFAGADAMGGTAAGRLSPTYYGASAAAPAIAGGLQSETLLAANLPPYTPTGLVSTPTINLTNNHDVPTTDQSGTVPYGGGTNAGTGNITATATTPTFMGIAQGGISAPLSNIQPTLTVNYIIKVVPNTSGAGGVVSIGGMFGDIICDATFLCANQTIGLATQLTGTILANIGSSAMTPTAVTLSQVMDYTCGSAQGDIFYRGSSSWSCLPPGTFGQLLQTQGPSANPVWFTAATGTGTVTSGVANQLAYYASTGPVVSGTNALPNGITATTQSAGDSTTKIATDAFTQVAVTAALGGIIDITRSPYNCSTSNTAAQNATCFTAALAALDATGGGVLWVPPATTPYIVGCFTIPQHGGSSSSAGVQNPFRITGGVSNYGAEVQVNPSVITGGARLDLRCNTNARITTLGLGVLEIDHITLMNGNTGGGDTVPFLLTTNTTLLIHDNLVIGDTSLQSTANIQSFIKIGNSTNGVQSNLPNSIGWSYGNLIYNNWADHIEMFWYAIPSGSSNVGQNLVYNNWISFYAGSSTHAAFECVGGTADCTDNIFTNNTMSQQATTAPPYSYPYGYRMQGGENQFINNIFSDQQPRTAYFRFDGSTGGNNVICNQCVPGPGSVPPMMQTNSRNGFFDPSGQVSSSTIGIQKFEGPIYGLYGAGNAGTTQFYGPQYGGISLSSTDNPTASCNLRLTESDLGADSWTLDRCSYGIYADLFIGNIHAGSAIAAKTANYPLVAKSDNGGTFTNTGTSGSINFTLPASPPPGFTVTLYLTIAQASAFVANTGQHIQDNGTTGGSGGNTTCSAIGCSITLRYVATNIWGVIDKVGTWTTT